MKSLHVLYPRGFCSGVARAVSMVRGALDGHGAPVFVYNEIVHNKSVLQELSELGAVFVNRLEDADPLRPLVLSAHGVPKHIEMAAKERHAIVIDAACPLVKKSHEKIESFPDDYEIVIIGDREHPEIIGLRGRIEKEARYVKTVADVAGLSLPESAKVGVVSQTTLNLDDVREIVEEIRKKYGCVEVQDSADLCEATKVRQQAVRDAAPGADLVVVLGSKNSSNSNNLRNVAIHAGARAAVLIDSAKEFDFDLPDECNNICVTAGASAPESLVRDFVSAFKSKYPDCEIFGNY